MSQATPNDGKLGEKLVAWLPDGPRIALKRRVRGVSERRRLARAELVVFGHPKSGNTWLRFQLARVYQHKYGLPESVIPDVEAMHGLDRRIPQIHMGAYTYVRPIIAGPAPAPELSGKGIVFIVRHPLDIMVSLYFHIQKHALHERKLFNNWPIDLSKTNMVEFTENPSWGLRPLIDFFNNCLRQHEKLGRSRIVSYEDMKLHPAQLLSDISALAGGSVSLQEADEAAAYASFDKLRQAELDNKFKTTRLRAANPRDPDSFKVRRAKVFGYHDYFGGESLERLQAIIDRDLDPRLGYGSSAGKSVIVS